MRVRYWLVALTSISVLFASKAALEHQCDKFNRPEVQLSFKASDGYAKSLKRYSFGFDSLISAVLWVELLQRSHREIASGDQFSWEFVLLDSITQLDPRFERAYSFGGVVLSVLIQDKQGAKKILERWVSREPRNWRVHYVLGYHLFFELKDFENASKHIFRAAELEGAPSWLNSLGVRLLSETGALEESLRLCLDLYGQVADIEGKDRLSLRIRSLNFKLQERAWNSALERFRLRFGREPNRTDELLPEVNDSVREVASSTGASSELAELGVLLKERFPFRYDKTLRRIEGAKNIGPIETGIYRPK